MKVDISEIRGKKIDRMEILSAEHAESGDTFIIWFEDCDKPLQINWPRGHSAYADDATIGYRCLNRLEDDTKAEIEGHVRFSFIGKPFSAYTVIATGSAVNFCGRRGIIDKVNGAEDSGVYVCQPFQSFEIEGHFIDE